MRELQIAVFGEGRFRGDRVYLSCLKSVFKIFGSLKPYHLKETFFIAHIDN